MANALADRVRAAETVAVARALTVVENDLEAGAALLAALHGSVGRAHRVGLTGPPGAGKSTLVSALARGWRRDGRRVGVVAVDPTSPFSGGALLGDRIRMTEHAGDAGVFVRSVASRGAGGGLSRGAHDAADVLDAAGFDPVMLETVGVGQGEVAIAAAADTVVVVVAPGGGDSVQAMKSGILEIADLIVVNQSDREGADRLVADLEAAVDLRAQPTQPRVLRTTATEGEGVDALRAAIDERAAAGAEAFRARREARALARIRDEVERRRGREFWAARGAALACLAAEVVDGTTTVAAAADRLLAKRAPDEAVD
jgi:LAO/AO transport system kinase